MEQTCAQCGTEFTLIDGPGWARCPCGHRPLTPTPPGALLVEFRAWLREDRGFSANTQDAYAYRAKVLLRILDRRGLDVATCTTQDLASALRETPLRASTRNHYRAALRSFFALLVVMGMREGNPAADLPKMRQARRLPRPLEDHELALYLKAADALGPRSLALAALGVYSGLRISEACELPWPNVGRDQLRIIGKGDRERRVPIAPALREALDAWEPLCPNRRWVFPSHGGPRARPGQPMTRQMAHDLHSEILRRAGLPQLPFHRLRHTFGTEALRVSRDLRAVQELLGHASPATTAIYTLVRNQRLAEVVGAMYRG